MFRSIGKTNSGTSNCESVGFVEIVAKLQSQIVLAADQPLELKRQVPKARCE